MKYLLIATLYFLGSLSSFSDSVPESFRKKEADQVALWEGKLAMARQLPESARISELWLGLRNMGYRKSGDGSSPEVANVYESIQQELLSIPGHAQYFAEELERVRAHDHTQGRINYVRELQIYVGEVLVHLPSPETVAVLGKMLEDMRDAPPPEDPSRDRHGSTMNPDRAAVTLSKLGIRDYPFGSEFQPIFYKITPWQEWWKEVKAGDRTFSFEGQNVEYRFKPDGTWDTIPMTPITKGPDIAARIPPIKVPSKEGQSQSAPERPKTPSTAPWGWIFGAIIVLVATLWISSKFRNSNQ